MGNLTKTLFSTMKAFAATLLITGLEASRGYGGYGGYGYGYAKSPVYGKTGYKTSVRNIPVTTYENQQRARTVYDNVQQNIRVPKNIQRQRTVYDTINQTVNDNVPRQVVDEITKTVIDNVPRTVIDKVQSTHIRQDRINESNDSGDGYNSGERIYVDSVSSDSSDDCHGWGCGNAYGKKSYGGYGASSSSDNCHGWGCASSNDSISSYVITSDSSADERIINTPVTTTRNVARTVIDKVPRQVTEKRARTVIDKVPRTINKRVARNVQKRVPRTVTDNITVYENQTINKRVPRTVIDNIRVPKTTIHQQVTKTPTYGKVGYSHSRIGGSSRRGASLLRRIGRKSHGY